MAQLIFKPRPNMQSWTAPEPRTPRRNWFYFWAITAWLLTVGVAYRWFADGPDNETAAWTFSGNVKGRDADGREGVSAEGIRASRASDVGSTAKKLALPPATPAPQRTAEEAEAKARRAGNASVSLACEDFLKQSNGAMDGRLPTHLERSPVDVFIGENAWTKPCRTRRRHTAQLCVAVQDGEVKGLSAVVSPPDLSIENCLREQAAKLVLQPEGSVRVIRTSLVL